MPIRLAVSGGVQMTDAGTRSTNQIDFDGASPIDESVDEADGVLQAHIVVQRFRQKQSLRAVFANEVRHAPILAARTPESESVALSFHTVCKIYGIGPSRSFADEEADCI